MNLMSGCVFVALEMNKQHGLGLCPPAQAGILGLPLSSTGQRLACGFMSCRDTAISVQWKDTLMLVYCPTEPTCYLTQLSYPNGLL